MLDLKLCWIGCALSLFIVFPTAESHGYMYEDCTCFGELNDTTRAELPSVAASAGLVPSKYEYMGLRQEGASYGACFCEDVTRYQGNLTLIDESTFNMTQHTNLSYTDDVTDSLLKTIIGGLEWNGTVLEDIINVHLVLTNSSVAPYTVWDVQLIYKQNIPLSQLATVENNFLSSVIDNIEAIYEIGTPPISFQMLQCSGTPTDAPEHGARVWDNKNYPGQPAFYGCDDTYVTVAEWHSLECSHFTLEWETPPTNMSCKKGCDGTPSNGPFFSTKSWDPDASKFDGSVAIYYCINGYRSKTGLNGSSTCENAEWTAVTSDFGCEQILCSLFIPQVPAHGRSDWDKSTVYIGTIVSYRCMNGYSSTRGNYVWARCDKEGNWTQLPDGYECINTQEALRLGYRDDDYIRPYDYYENEELLTEPAVLNWFLIVTIPSLSAMALIILCCLCCTRTDSPVHRVFRNDAKSRGYAPI